MFVTWILCLGALVAAQVSAIPPPPPQIRDSTAPPPPPTERRIPIGTATLSGSVVTAEGRPVKDARVTVSGQIPQNMQTASGQVVVGGMRGGVPGGIPMSEMARGGGAPASVSRVTLTDASGQFSFPRLPAGQFTVSVNHNQFLQMSYGQRRPGGSPAFIPLTDGQQVTLKIAMVRGGVISGRVLGPDGETMTGVQLRAWRYTFNTGVKRLQAMNYAQVDDRGMYRIFGLQPGEYLISATPGGDTSPMMAQMELIERAIASGQVIPPATKGQTPTVSVQIPSQQQSGQYVPPPGYVPTFAPSTTEIRDATTIAVAGDEERAGVDIFVRLTQASLIQGEVLMPADPEVAVQLTLINDDPILETGENQSRPDASGKFYFRGVRPGKYTVLAATVPAPVMQVQGKPPIQPTLTDAQKLWGRVPVTVSGEHTIGVSVTMRPGRTISGVVLFNMATPPDLTRTRVSVTLNFAPAGPQVYYGPMPQAQVAPDGQFALTGVVPGRYLLRVNGGGMIKSAMVGAHDTLDFPLEFSGETDISGAVLTLTDTLSELSGGLTDAAGKPAISYMIIAAATDSRYWTPSSRRVVITRPGPDGRYRFNGLPAGTYSLCAVIDFEQGAQYDPEFLRTLAAASVTVTVPDGGKVQQDLRVK